MEIGKTKIIQHADLGLVWEKGNIPYSEAYGDHFYSGNNGRDECHHVFVEGNNLPQRLPGSECFTIAELGFGTGLNFLHTWDYWRKIRGKQQVLNFVSFERHPLDGSSINRGLSQWPELENLTGNLLDFWGTRTKITDIWQVDHQTTLQVYYLEANAGIDLWSGNADAWYLDGFSPAVNPDMWSAGLMEKLFRHTKTNGTFATYSSAGWVRGNLADAGFEVMRVPGHGKKRHMSVGIKKADFPPHL